MIKPLGFDISNDMLNIVVGISTIIIGLISFGIEIGENRFFRFFKYLSFRIPVLILFSSIIIWATVIKDKNNDIKNSNDVSIRDSINQNKFNESLSKASSSYASSSSKTMAKYYLKYDSNQHKIERIVKDSLKKPSEFNPIPELNTNITTGTLSKDTLRLETPIVATQAAVYNLKYKSAYIIRRNLSDYSDQNLEIMPNTSSQIGHNKITIDQPQVDRFIVSSDEFKLNPHFVYIYMKGMYESQKGKVFNFESLNRYNISNNTCAPLTDNEFKWIYHYIKSKLK